MGKFMRKWIVMLLAMSAIELIALSIATAQQADVVFWISSAQINVADVDFAIPAGPSRSVNVDLCTGTGSCPSGCPKPVQDFIFVKKGGGTTRVKDIVLSAEVKPGSKCRQFTASSSCTTADASGNRVEWYKFVASICD